MGRQFLINRLPLFFFTKRIINACFGEDTIGHGRERILKKLEDVSSKDAKRLDRILQAIGLLQLTITWYKIRHAGGQAHYYSRTGTLKQRDLNQ